MVKSFGIGFGVPFGGGGGASLAQTYAQEYQTAVEADGGTIIDFDTVVSEYQRLIDSGNLDSCWFSYHYQCGVKINVVDYGGGDKNMVYKWYNLSRVAGRFAESVTAYSIVAGSDARAEWTSDGLLFRPVNLDGGTRCGLESPSSTVLTNNNNIVSMRAIVKPVGTSTSIGGHGYVGSADGNIAISDQTANRKLQVYYYTGAINTSVASNEDNVFANNTEVEVDFTFDFAALSINMNKDGVALTPGAILGCVYPQMSYPDLIGCYRNLARTPYNGYIKQIELFVL